MDQSRQLTGYGWLALIGLCGAVLRWSQAGESLWLDELHTSWTVTAGFSSILDRARLGNQSPVYFLITWGSIQLCGEHEWSLRLPSLVAGTVMIPLVGWLVWHWSTSRSGGLFAAWWVACSRDCIFYAQEARPYAVLQLGALLHGWLFLDLLSHPTVKRRVLFLVGGAVLFYVHYTIFLFFVAELVCWAVCCWCGQRRGRPLPYGTRQVMVDTGWLILLLLPAVPHLQTIGSRRAAWARLVDLWPSPALWGNLLILVGIPVFSWLVTRWVSRRPIVGRPIERPLFWAGCWFAIPLGLAWLSTLSGLAALWMLRYLVAALVGMFLFAGMALVLIDSRRGRTAVGLVVLVSLIGHGGLIAQWQRDGRLVGDRAEDWRAAVHWLNAAWPAERLPLLLMPGLLEDAMLAANSDDALRQYCRFPLRGLYFFAGDRIEPLPTTTTRPLPETSLQASREAGGAWLMVRTRPAHFDRYLTYFRHALGDEEDQVQLVERRSFGNLVVARVRFAARDTGE